MDSYENIDSFTLCLAFSIVSLRQSKSLRTSTPQALFLPEADGSVSKWHPDTEASPYSPIVCRRYITSELLHIVFKEQTLSRMA